MRFPIVLLCIALWAAPRNAMATVDGKSSESDIDRKIDRAEELFEAGHTAQSRQVCESLLRSLTDRSSLQLAHVLNLMSKIYASEGDYENAIASATRSAVAYEQVRDPGGESHALNNKGIAELQNGSYSTALRDLERALTLSQSGNDLENQTQVLNNLGSAHYFLGSYSEATGAYEKAMSIVKNNTSTKWSDYWLEITRFNQATLLQRLGRYAAALQVYREVQASSKALSVGDRAHLDANLGTLYRRLGDPYKAMGAYLSAQKLYSKQHDADGEIAVLKNIGIAYALDLNDLPRAASIFRTALALAEKTHNRREEMQAHLYLGETFFRSQALTPARQEFECAQTLATQLATTEEHWKSLYGLARIEASRGDLKNAERDYRRAISLIEQTRSQLQLSALRSEFFADKREAYDGLISILLNKNEASEAFLFLEKSRARNFQDRMQKDQESVALPLTLEQVQAGLAPQTGLLEFWASGDQIGLIWCTHETAGLKIKQLTLEQQTRIQELLRKIPNSLPSSNGGDNDNNNDHEDSPLNAILAEDWQFPPGVHHLLIVPDAWLSYVPFDLLRAERNSGTLWIERYDISYLPSAALLRRIPAPHRVYWPWTRELVAFGDPIVNVEESGNQLKNADQPGTQSLPFSAKEIEDVSHLTRGTCLLFLQRGDLKKAFLNGTSNSAPLLHVSTHAFADGDNPEDSRLLFSADTADSAPPYVFLRELYDLDLRHVNLATISACDTERGKIIRGEGVQAFGRALVSAGAASSLTALWRIDDQVTAEFMKQFYYFLLQQNKPKAEALRLAKLKFLHSKSGSANPSAWAGFVLNGDGLTPVPRVLSWRELLLAAVGLAAALLLIVVLTVRLGSRRRRHGQDSPPGVVAQ
jgi:CHAT domain-containing protein